MTGRSFTMNYVSYRVCGVVRSGSYLTPNSYAQVYVPYSVSPDYRKSQYGIDYLGAFNVTFLVKIVNRQKHCGMIFRRLFVKRT